MQRLHPWCLCSILISASFEIFVPLFPFGVCEYKRRNSSSSFLWGVVERRNEVSRNRYLLLILVNHNWYINVSFSIQKCILIYLFLKNSTISFTGLGFNLTFQSPGKHLIYLVQAYLSSKKAITPLSVSDLIHLPAFCKTLVIAGNT